MHAIITKNAADATLHGSEFGTLEAGKMADIVIVDGDPLRDVGLLCQREKLTLVLKGGAVQVDRRSTEGAR